jgi:hypothetical protein
LCKTEKPLNAFGVHSRRTGVKHCWCRECTNFKAKEWRKKNPKKVAANSKKWREQNAERAAALRRRGHLKSLYGLSPEDYEKALSEQRGCCAICGAAEHASKTRGGQHRFHIDHDHKTGRVRGLLCANCNRMIGQAKESVDVLWEAIAYLEEHKAGDPQEVNHV